MKSIDEFMKENGITNRKKVEGWIEKKWVTGVKKDKKGNYIFHDFSRPPYTARRAKEVSAIYASIVRACNKRKGVTPALYNLTRREFEIYVHNLEREGLIMIKKEGKDEFYFATIKSEQYINKDKQLKKIIIELFSIGLNAFIDGMLD